MRSVKSFSFSSKRFRMQTPSPSCYRILVRTSGCQYVGQYHLDAICLSVSVTEPTRCKLGSFTYGDRGASSVWPLVCSRPGCSRRRGASAEGERSPRAPPCADVMRCNTGVWASFSWLPVTRGPRLGGLNHPFWRQEVRTAPPT